jgi:hypothetical protein
VRIGCRGALRVVQEGFLVGEEEVSLWKIFLASRGHLESLDCSLLETWVDSLYLSEEARLGRSHKKYNRQSGND